MSVSLCLDKSPAAQEKDEALNVNKPDHSDVQHRPVNAMRFQHEWRRARTHDQRATFFNVDCCRVCAAQLVIPGSQSIAVCQHTRIFVGLVIVLPPSEELFANGVSVRNVCRPNVAANHGFQPFAELTQLGAVYPGARGHCGALRLRKRFALHLQHLNRLRGGINRAFSSDSCCAPVGSVSSAFSVLQLSGRFRSVRPVFFVVHVDHPCSKLAHHDCPPPLSGNHDARRGT
eukprot:scaffold330_cov109-Isochrysis_galbana.AAC.3